MNRLILIAAPVLVLGGCGRTAPAPVPPVEEVLPPVTVPPVVSAEPILLTDVTAVLGAGPIQGQGVALVDYNHDGLPDITLAAEEGLYLWRNLGGFAFERDNERANLPPQSVIHALSPVFVDVDDDGDLDLFVATRRGADRLFSNDGQGRFEDVTEAAGFGVWTLSYGASFGDLDGDGDLDLLTLGGADFSEVATPVPDNAFDLDENACSSGYVPPSEAESEEALGCASGFRGSPNRYWRNDGGVFTDVTDEVGLGGEPYDESFQSLFFDFDGDGDLDVLVARDHRSGQLFLNDGTGHFEDVSAAWVPDDTRGLMGFDVGDVDRDGVLDIYGTYTKHDVLLSVRSGGSTKLLDWMAEAVGGGIDPTTFTEGWGIALADLDNDGDVDVLTTSATSEVHALGWESEPVLWPGRMIVFENRVGSNKGEMLVEITADAFHSDPGTLHGQGLAVGDLDGDGDLDAIVGIVGTPQFATQEPHRATPLLLRNDGAGGRKNGSLIIRLEQPDTNRFAVGARIDVETERGRATRLVTAGISYLSCQGYDQHFGLADQRAATVRVTWPDGTVQSFSCEGTGRRVIRRDGDSDCQPEG